MNIPNVLTFIRLLFVPLFAVCFFIDNIHNLQISSAIFFAAGVTDILDGYIARKYNLITKAGIVLDPLADKLMLLTVLLCLSLKLYIPIWIFLIILAKELSMILFGIYLYQNNIIIPSNKFGKISSFLFFIAILLFVYNNHIGKILLYVAITSAIIAFINYVIVYYNKVKEITIENK